MRLKLISCMCVYNRHDVGPYHLIFHSLSSFFFLFPIEQLNHVTVLNKNHWKIFRLSIKFSHHFLRYSSGPRNVLGSGEQRLELKSEVLCLRCYTCLSCVLGGRGMLEQISWLITFYCLVMLGREYQVYTKLRSNKEKHPCGWRESLMWWDNAIWCCS